MLRTLLILRRISTQRKNGALRSGDKWLDGVKKLVKDLEKDLENRGLTKTPVQLEKHRDAMEVFMKRHVEEFHKFLKFLKSKLEESAKLNKERLNEEIKKLKIAMSNLEGAMGKPGGSELKSALESVKKQLENVGSKTNVAFDKEMEKEFKEIWEGLTKKVKGVASDFRRNIEIYHIHTNIEHALSEAERALSLPDPVNRTEILHHQKEKLIKFLGEMETKLVAQLRTLPTMRHGIPRVEESTVEAIAAINVNKEKIQMMDPELLVSRMRKGYEKFKAEAGEAADKGVKASKQLEMHYRELDSWLAELQESVVGLLGEMGSKEPMVMVKGELEEKVTGIRRILTEFQAAVVEKVKMHPELSGPLGEVKTQVEETRAKMEKLSSPEELKAVLQASKKKIVVFQGKTKNELAKVKEGLDELTKLFPKKNAVSK